MTDDPRADIEKAFDQVEKTAEPEAKVEEVKPVEEKPVEEKPVEEKPVEEKPVEEKPVEEKTVEEKAEVKAETTIKPPQSWKPGVREHWSKLPAEVQQEVTRRELEISRALNHSAGARKIAEQFYNVVQPYEGLIKASNSTPLQTVSNMLQTAARLRIGTPLERAQAAAEVINSFGVDIQILDQILAGSPEIAEQRRIDEAVRQRMAPFQQRDQQLAQEEFRRQQEEEQAAEAQLASFAESHEFFEDVRIEMADFIDVAKSRGLTLSLQDAYDRAVNVRPDLKKIIDQRAAAAVIKSREAASSVPARSAPVRKAEPETSRGAIEQAWDQHAR